MTSPLSKLGIGSEQLALDQQGVMVRGRSPEVEARDVLDIAARARLPVFDIAGRSIQAEISLGRLMPRPMPFRISISTVRPDKGPDVVEAEARAALQRLGVDQADALLVPSAADLFSPHGQAMWERMKILKAEGLTRKIGVSLFASDDPIGVARRFRPDIIQVPASLLDQRLLVDGTLATVAGMGIEVHLRSIFLNGLLFLPPDRAPSHL
ncbi:MAG: bifunctional regulator KidO, partial [Verrucomicrobiaceae bacterium]